MKYILHPGALAESSEAAEYYENQKTGLGLEFINELKAVLGRVVQNPRQFGLISGNLRQAKPRRFPYGVIYSIQGAELFVVAVPHLHRRPGYWRNRLS